MPKISLEKKAFKVAEATAIKAGKLLLKEFHSKREIQFKGNTNNLVTDMDKASEELIVKAIQKEFPSHSIIAEERPILNYGSPYQWYIDPLDGTTNYTHGFPVFCVSIGFEVNDKPLLGVVYNPNLNEIFHAIKGDGAYRNGKHVRISKTNKISESLLATGFPYDLKTSKNNNLNYFNTFIMHARAIRRAGSAALDLCYTACGIFDGFWEIKLGPWDIAASSIIAKEAGATVTDFYDNKLNLYKGEIIASNGLIHKEMLKIIRKAKAKNDFL